MKIRQIHPFQEIQNISDLDYKLYNIYLPPYIFALIPDLVHKFMLNKKLIRIFLKVCTARYFFFLVKPLQF